VFTVEKVKHMNRYWPHVTAAVGIMVVIGGLFYDALFAGIPYQDPTPEMTARYDFHSNVALAIRWTGLGIALVGAIGITVRRVMRGDLTPR
jgi:hypothetical protein